MHILLTGGLGVVAGEWFAGVDRGSAVVIRGSKSDNLCGVLAETLTHATKKRASSTTEQ